MSKQTQDFAVDLYQIKKSFLKGNRLGSYTSIKSLFANLFRRKDESGQDYIHAIKDLTVRIPRGSSVGVIGSNGSGKSTLLKLITGIYQVDSGHVEVSGRVAALIELGAGFHPDFTGRENLYLGGILHGLKNKEIDQLFDEIVEFAELENFIDQPVRTYSSGMFMRLGFSLAIHTDPEILLIDEVLAVGDAKFVAKCQERISELRASGKTLFLVSHDLAAIERWSDEVIWLEKGIVKDRGEPRRVIDAYLTYVNDEQESELEEARAEEIEEEVVEHAEQDVSEMFSKQRWGSREVEILTTEIQDYSAKSKLLFASHEPAVISMEFKLNHQIDLEDLVFGFGIKNSAGVQLVATNTDIDHHKFTITDNCQTGVVQVIIPRMLFANGTYYLDVAVHRQDGYSYDYHKNVIKFKVTANEKQLGVVDFAHSWNVATENIVKDIKFNKHA